MPEKNKVISITAVIVLCIDITLLLYSASRTGSTSLASLITQAIIIIIAGLFLFCIKQLIVNNPKWKSFAGSIPSFLTSIGILGTFAGIFIGLVNFNTEPGMLDESVKLLLEGMKVAFSTSIAGLSSSLSLRVAHSIVVSIEMNDPFGDPFSSPTDNMMIMSVPDLEKHIATLNRTIGNLHKVVTDLAAVIKNRISK